MDISVAIVVAILDFGHVVKVLSMAIYEVKDTLSYHFKNHSYCNVVGVRPFFGKTIPQ